MNNNYLSYKILLLTMNILSQEFYNNRDYYDNMQYVYKPNNGNLEIGNLVILEYYSHDISGYKSFSYKKETMIISDIINSYIKCYPVIAIDITKKIAHLINVEYVYKLVNNNWYQIYENEDLDINDCCEINKVTSETLLNVDNIKRTYVSDGIISEYVGIHINGLVDSSKYLPGISYDNIPIWCNKY